MSLPLAETPLRIPVRHALARLRTTLHAIVGAPDYERYLAHVRERHPERTPMTRREFACDRLAARYDRPGSRCC